MQYLACMSSPLSALKLRKAIATAGHNNMSLAMQSGLPIRTIQDMLAGRDCKCSTLAKFAKATRRTPGYFFEKV